MVRSLIRLPNSIVLAYLEVPKVVKPGPTDRPTEFAIGICHLVNTKCHKNIDRLFALPGLQIFCIYIFNLFNLLYPKSKLQTNGLTLNQKKTGDSPMTNKKCSKFTEAIWTSTQ